MPTVELSLLPLLSEEACYQWLLELLHPRGLCCPLGHKLPKDQAPHDRTRAPVLKYKCRICGAAFHLFTNTPLRGVRHSCSKLVLILQGIAKGTTTQELAEELKLSRRHLLELRHRVQAEAPGRFPPLPRRGARRRG